MSIYVHSWRALWQGWRYWAQWRSCRCCAPTSLSEGRRLLARSKFSSISRQRNFWSDSAINVFSFSNISDSALYDFLKKKSFEVFAKILFVHISWNFWNIPLYNQDIPKNRGKIGKMHCQKKQTYCVQNFLCLMFLCVMFHKVSKIRWVNSCCLISKNKFKNAFLHFFTYSY